MISIFVTNVEKKQLKPLKVLNANIFTRILYKTNFSNKKNNQFLLSVDLLKREAKKDLFYICSKNVENVFNRLFKKRDPIFYIRNNGDKIFLYLLKNICEEFLTKQYGYRIKVDQVKLKQSLYTKNLLNDLAIFFQVPFIALVNPQSGEFKSIYYPIYNYASESFLEALIDNLIIEIANCTIYYVVINFSFLYAFRQTLYRSTFLSLRNFERFKNNLIWQLQIRSSIQRPADFYNSRYRIFVFRTNGIYSRVIYANRSNQVLLLTKFSLLTITFIELKDFLVSRVEEALYIVSKGARFALTSVLGQSIGLVWRGIIDGLKK